MLKFVTEATKYNTYNSRYNTYNSRYNTYNSKDWTDMMEYVSIQGVQFPKYKFHCDVLRHIESRETCPIRLKLLMKLEPKDQLRLLPKLYLSSFNAFEFLVEVYNTGVTNYEVLHKEVRALDGTKLAGKALRSDFSIGVWRAILNGDVPKGKQRILKKIPRIHQIGFLRNMNMSDRKFAVEVACWCNANGIKVEGDWVSRLLKAQAEGWPERPKVVMIKVPTIIPTGYTYKGVGNLKIGQSFVSIGNTANVAKVATIDTTVSYVLLEPKWEWPTEIPKGAWLYRNYDNWFLSTMRPKVKDGRYFCVDGSITQIVQPELITWKLPTHLKGLSACIQKP